MKRINRRLNDQEQKTADHIREFIKQAKAALAIGDVDGASTLAAKAKVLFDRTATLAARSAPICSPRFYSSPQLSLLRSASKNPLSLSRTSFTV